MKLSDLYDACSLSALWAALETKVDKVTGKQLSTEDFTTALKTKLEGLTSFVYTTGTSNFVGFGNARTIAHGLGVNPKFAVIVPTQGASATIGEMYYGFDATNLYVYNTGAAQSEFYYYIQA